MSFQFNPASKAFLQQCWNAMLRRLQYPVEGIALPLSLAQELGEPLLNRLLDFDPDLKNEAEFSSEALRTSAIEAKEATAEERHLSSDQERYRDPEDTRYPKNLHLPHLQQTNSTGRFDHSEWALLDAFLRPFAYPRILKHHLSREDADEVFNSTLASLTRTTEKKPKAPIQEMIVFEETIPNFCRLVSLRSIDWIRRHTSQKARPESLASLDAMTTDEGTALELPDHSASQPNEPATWKFEEIYRQCQELLTPTQWTLIYKLYIAQTHTVKDLVKDTHEISQLGFDPEQSASTLRRRIDDLVQPALAELADALAI